MAEYQSIDDAHPTVPDVLALDEVAVGTGASIVVAVAATIAVLLAVTVATLSSAAAAPSAEPRSEWTELRPAADGRLVVADALLPARDGLYTVASPAPKAEKSIAMAVVAGLLLAMAAATSMAWRAFNRSLVAAARRASTGRVATRRR